MLAQLYVKNYVLIEKASIDFEDGFHVFTGETGAGKSLLLDALSFVSGMRSQAKVVGPYAEEAFVEAVFYLQEDHPAHALMEAMHFDQESVLVVQRTMSAQGRSIAKVNDRHITLGKLQRIMNTVIDIHRQDETQAALKQSNHLALLDRFAQIDFVGSEYEKVYQAYKASEAKLKAFKDEREDPETLDFYRYQLKNLDALNPDEKEYQDLMEEVEYLENFEKYHRAFELIDSSLSNALSQIYEAEEVSDDLFDEAIQNRIQSIYLDLEDFYHDFSNSRRSDHFDEHRFNALNERLFEYQQLIRKHGSIEEVLSYQNDLRQRLEEAENYDLYRQDLEEELKKQKIKLEKEAQKIHEKRLQAADKLVPLVENELKDLLLEQAKFRIVIEKGAVHAKGFDEVRFMVSMNPGMPLQDIENSASGGEKSRLMLGLKVAFSKVYDVETFIFDEIDTGLSGQAGFAIGDKMKQLAEEKQVMSITHLASVAACADEHLKIYKEASRTDVLRLNEQERLEEMALMISAEINEASLEAAKELYRKGQS